MCCFRWLVVCCFAGSPGCGSLPELSAGVALVTPHAPSYVGIKG